MAVRLALAAYDNYATNMSRPNLLSLFRQFSAMGRDIAVVGTHGYRRHAFSYSELTTSALRWSQAIALHGVAPGDRVLLWGPNSFLWVSCFWATLLRGAVVVPMDAGASPDFVDRVIRDSQANLILRASAQSQLPTNLPSLVYDNRDDRPAPAASTLADEPGFRCARADAAEILFTSGTTSEPRGVVLTHGNFLANLEPIEQGIDEYRRRERWFHPLRFVTLVPLSHVFGQFMGLFIPPLLGAAVVFENSSLPADALRSIKRERATVLVAVPRMLDSVRGAFEREIDSRGWRGWFDRAYEAAKDEWFWFRPWRFRRLHSLFGWKFWAFLSGGAALSSDTEDFFKRLGYAVVQGYGMTETASLISVNHPFDAKEGSVGKALPGRELRIAEDGEILVRGENVSAGYWEKGALRSLSERHGGWLSTGDLGELDAEGNLRFRGRKKNVIVTPAGLNVFPEDLEAALRKQPAIRDAVVVRLEIGGNAEPAAALILNPSVIPNGVFAASKLSSHSPDQAVRSAIDSANATLADYQRIRHWLLWPDPDFPRTATGKARLAVIASRVRELLGTANSAGAPHPLLSSHHSVIRSEPRNLLSSSLPASLKDLSSLDRVELLSSLEHRFNVELNETQFANAQTVADVQQLLAQPCSRRTDFVYPRWPQRAWTRFARLLVYYAISWPVTVLLAHPSVRGKENLAKAKAPVLIVCNHTTRRADIGLVLYALPARFRNRLATAMGGENLRNFRHPPREWFFAKRWLWQIGYFLLVSLFNVFPLPQSSGFRESFRFAGESADRGYNILVFPEGVINDRDAPGMLPFQSGIGLLAQNLNIPIVPMRIDGLWQMKQERRRLAHRGELTVHIGRPFRFPANTPAANITFELERLVESL